jgi:hypothetical protein
VNGEAVELSDMIWAEKLAAHNASAAKIMRQARRKASNPDMTEDNLDGFLNALDLGDPDPTRHKRVLIVPMKSWIFLKEKILMKKEIKIGEDAIK